MYILIEGSLGKSKYQQSEIGSRLNYSRLCFGTAAQTNLKRLNVIEAEAPVLCFGALHTPPPLLVEIG